MSRTGTTLEAVKTLGPIPKTMPRRCLPRKGHRPRRGSPRPRSRRQRSPHQSCRLRHLRHRHQEDLSRLRSAATDSGPRSGRHSGCVGRGMTKWKPGDRVMSFHHIPCGACFYCERRLFSQCKQYKTTGLTGGFTPNGGGFAEYVKAMPWVADRGIVALPDDVSFEEATFIEPIQYDCESCAEGPRSGRRNRVDRRLAAPSACNC